MKSTVVDIKPASRQQASAAKNAIWDLKWVREPQQDRSARTRGKLLDAAEKLLASDGIRGVTIASVTKLANSSNGSFYHYFQDKQALLYAVVERNAIDISVTVTRGLDPETWEDVPLIDILEGFVRFSLKAGKRNIGIVEAQQQLAREDENIAARIAKTRRETQAAIMTIMEPKLSQIGHPDPAEALGFIYDVLRTMTNQRLRRIAEQGVSRQKQSEDAFVYELREMAAAYLQINS